MCLRFIILVIAALTVEGSPIFNMQATNSGTNFVMRRNRHLNNKKWYSSYYNEINNDSVKLAEIYGVPGNIEQVNIYRDPNVVLYVTPSEPNKVYTEQSFNSDFVNTKHSISPKPFVENSHLFNTKRNEALYQNSGLVFEDDMQSNVKDSHNVDCSTETLKVQENHINMQKADYDKRKSGSAASEMDINNGKVGALQPGNDNKQDSMVIKQKPVTNDKSVESGVERNHDTINTNVYDGAMTGEDETTTFIPDIRNRVSFDGGSCPTGQIKVAGKCVYVDT